MDNQRPREFGPDDEPTNDDLTPETPDEGVTPDQQPTQPIAVPRGTAPAASGEDAERLALLRRLSPTELAVLRHRCAGATTAQIATHLGITQADARIHAGNLLDKLGVTYGRQGTSLSRLTAFCPLASQLGASAGTSGLPVEPPSGMPSQRAAELTDADDLALASQYGGMPPSGGNDGRQRWVLGGVLAFVLVAALVALLFFLAGDDDGDDATADEQATEEVATETAEAAAVEPTATVEVPEDTPEPEPTQTEIPPTETPEPDEEATEEAATETAEAEPEPTETEVPPTETLEPTATSTPEEPEPTATTAEPEPTPDEGQLAYEADWSSGEDGWNLTDGWAIENGDLVTTAAGAAPLLAPFEPEQPDYAVEIEMTVTGLTGCDERAGVFARVTEESDPSGDVLVGYTGNVCQDEWHIDAITADGRDALADGDHRLASGSHTYRLEVSGDQIRLYIDDDFAGAAIDNRWTAAGGAGIYIDGDLDVTVSAFRVFNIGGS
jgi:DNA-binding CsgD family transcriptional regulator/outer membrane biosynthesis protein TonB